MAPLRPTMLRGCVRICRTPLSLKQQQQTHIFRQTRTLSLPSFDYKYIRDNADSLLNDAIKRNVKDAQPHRVGQLYDEFCTLTTAANSSRSSLNTVSKELAVLIKEIKKCTDADDKKTKTEKLARLRDRAKALKMTIQGTEATLAGVQASMTREAARIPNVSHPDAPEGDESHARIVRIHGTLHKIDRVPEDGVDTAKLSQTPFADHLSLAERLGLVDMAAGASVAGSRFHYWRGAGALLELALVQYAMTRAVAAGFEPHITPDIARSSVVDACGFRPRPDAHDGSSGEASQIYRVTPVAEEARDDTAAADPLCLVATAEIPLVAMRKQTVLSSASLPQSFAGLSHCFRAEAGARGRDTRGLYRLHQFTKVELVTLAHPDGSDAELARLVDFQTALYADLGLTFRVLQMPTHELGAAAYQKVDIEAWMPGRRAWGEISSASNCTDYQSRRLGIRTRMLGAQSSETPVFVHTLNATAVAVPRLVVALLESFQRPDGNVVVPEALHPWMMGINVLSPSVLDSH
ncbi:Serine--tRNA ligase, mitochondrial [Coemansia sp. RSA 1813]|nr:Serine--tRNA ligase, mitochondrial [Coemansia sp. RSA 1646]KAJ1769963.1 Serine--tRNA ligase, mitochondrial [Coemansia sp. RSA 1843]KAJ2087874.1 Serine--tRNA ligase, mitochondrial [Coemansia sp. RSA 986]KAJ2212767.1 Serine--tRNA ligase, mitochondrial [Coemansia sp. RSA 487]KAJ2567506.1 Serine--tRNA ligase, mitochondrial [Coemansia sp. RSA 1813]